MLLTFHNAVAADTVPTEMESVSLTLVTTLSLDGHHGAQVWLRGAPVSVAKSLSAQFPVPTLRPLHVSVGRGVQSCVSIQTFPCTDTADVSNLKGLGNSKT